VGGKPQSYWWGAIASEKIETDMEVNLTNFTTWEHLTQQFSFQKVTIYTDRKRDLTGGKIAIANQCWTGVISAIQSL
jgi:hypothetical protein